MSIITGVLLGLTTLVFIGPVLFYLIKSSIESGFKAGIAVSLGIISGDIICVFIALYGAEYLFINSEYQKWFALCGGLILLIIGLKYIVKPNVSTNVNGKLQNKKLVTYFINGFLINLVNPFVFAVWIGFVSYNATKFSSVEIAISLGFTLLTIFTTDVLKAYFANKLMYLMKPRKITRLFKIFGGLMILFSFRLIVFYLMA